MLFIDTETSGWPKDWHKPYSAKGNWPYIVQVAWLIYTKDGKEIKSENHFINDNDFTIAAAAEKIHSITREFLLHNGKSRKTVMQILFEDLQKYRPLVIGYFVQLDYHMLSAGFYRAGMENPLEELPTFCVMKATTTYFHSFYRKYPALDQLYEMLFQTPLKHHHDALADASATARCFFELVKQGSINEKIIVEQQIVENEGKQRDHTVQLIIFFLVILILMVIIYLYYV